MTSVPELGGVGLTLGDRGPDWRGAAKWTLGALLAIDIALLLAVLSFANVTSEGAAKRTLGHSMAVLIEVDTYLEDHYEALRLEAFRTDDDEIEAPDLPVEVTFAPDEVQDASQEELRALLLERAAERVYTDGVDAFREDRPDGVSFFSTEGALRSGMDLLRPSPHRVLTALTIAFASAGGLLAGALLLASGSYGRLVALGLSVLAAALPFVVLAVAVRFAFRVAADGADDPFSTEYLSLAGELTWAPIRNGIIFATGAGTVLVAGALLATWNDRIRRI